MHTYMHRRVKHDKHDKHGCLHRSGHLQFLYIYVSLHLRMQNAVPRSTLCWKVGNISGSTELFAL